MKPVLTSFALLALASVIGCAQRSATPEAAPLSKEIPPPPPPRSSAATVGVLDDDYTPNPRREPQVRFDPIELTPEQKETLGITEPRLPDAAVFYTPAPSPQRGVDPLTSQSLFTGEHGIGGGSVTVDFLTPPYTAVYSSPEARYLGWFEQRTPTGMRIPIAQPPSTGVAGTTRQDLLQAGRRDGAGVSPDLR